MRDPETAAVGMSPDDPRTRTLEAVGLIAGQYGVGDQLEAPKATADRQPEAIAWPVEAVAASPVEVPAAAALRGRTVWLA